MEEEVECVIKVALLMLVAGLVESGGVKNKRPGVLVEVLKERRMFVELNWISVDKV